MVYEFFHLWAPMADEFSQALQKETSLVVGCQPHGSVVAILVRFQFLAHRLDVYGVRSVFHGSLQGVHVAANTGVAMQVSLNLVTFNRQENYEWPLAGSKGLKRNRHSGTNSI